MHRLAKRAYRGVGIANHGVDVPGLDDGGRFGQFGHHGLTVVVPSPGINSAILVEGERILFAGTNGNDISEFLVDRATLTVILRVHRVGVGRAPANHGAPVGEGKGVIESGTDSLDATERLDEVLLHQELIAPADDGFIAGNDKGVFVAGGDGFDIADAGHIGLALAVTSPADDGAVVFEGDDVTVVGRDCLYAGAGICRDIELAEVVLTPGKDAAILAEDDGPIRAHFDLFDGNIAHIARQGSLSLAVKSPRDHGAVMEDTEGE